MTPSLRDRLIPWYFVLFFLVVGAVDALMVTLAVSTHTGTVTDHPYEKGLAYNRVVAAAAAQEELGWKAEIRLASGQLHFTLHDASGQPLAWQSLVLHFTRPMQPEMDYETKISPGSAVAAPQPGLWYVRAIAQVGDIAYQYHQRMVIK